MSLSPEIQAIAKDMINVRRHLHRNPEVSYKEFETSKFIVSELRKLEGLEIVEKVAKTGVVATLTGTAGKGPCILLRADMDALPLQELSSKWNSEYKSTRDGVHHACGHDGHVAMLLAAARVLSGSRQRLKGVVKFVFQPAEEAEGGALPMIQEGVLDGRIGPKVDQVYGIHLMAVIPFGLVGVRNGPLMASCDTFKITIEGQGGHAAYPASARDPIVAGSHLVTQLHTVVSRNVPPTDTAVLSVCVFHSGTKENVIPSTAHLEGTVRTFDSKIKKNVKQRVHDICHGITKSLDVKTNLSYEDLYPATINTSAPHVEIVREIARDVVGSSKVVEPSLTMGAEDFSYFLQERPGCFFFVGASLTPKGEPFLQHHSPEFDFDENALLIGASIWVKLINSLLGEGKKIKSSL